MGNPWPRYIWIDNLRNRGKKLPPRKIRNPYNAPRSFNGNLETARKALAFNFYIGVTGPVTYKSAEEKRNIIKQLPLTQLLIETDSPFLTPVPHRGKRNEPAFVTYIADKIAEIHRITREQVAEITARNAAHLFGWEADA